MIVDHRIAAPQLVCRPTVIEASDKDVKTFGFFQLETSVPFLRLTASTALVSIARALVPRSASTETNLLQDHLTSEPAELSPCSESSSIKVHHDLMLIVQGETIRFLGRLGSLSSGPQLRRSSFEKSKSSCSWQDLIANLRGERLCPLVPLSPRRRHQSRPVPS